MNAVNWGESSHLSDNLEARVNLVVLIVVGSDYKLPSRPIGSGIVDANYDNRCRLCCWQILGDCDNDSVVVDHVWLLTNRDIVFSRNTSEAWGFGTDSIARHCVDSQSELYRNVDVNESSLRD